MLSPKSKTRAEASMGRVWVRWKWFTRVSESKWEGLGGCRDRQISEWGSETIADRVRKTSSWIVIMGEELKSDKVGRGGISIASSCSSWNADCNLGSKDWMCVIVFVISWMSFEASRFWSVETDDDISGRMRSDSGLNLLTQSLRVWISDGTFCRQRGMPVSS